MLLLVCIHLDDDSRKTNFLLQGTNHSQSLWEKSKNSFAGKEGTCWFPFQLWAYDWRVQTSAACLSVASTLDRNTQISFSATLLCFPVVPVRICCRCRCVGLCGPLLWRARVLRRLLSLRGARVQQRRGFVGVEGPAVVLRPRGTWRPVLWHPPEVLQRAFSSLVVAGTEIIRTSSLGVRMPEISFIVSF